MARSSSCELSEQEHFLVFFSLWRWHTSYGAISFRDNKGIKTDSSDRLQERDQRRDCKVMYLLSIAMQM